MQLNYTFTFIGWNEYEKKKLKRMKHEYQGKKNEQQHQRFSFSPIIERLKIVFGCGISYLIFFFYFVYECFVWTYTKNENMEETQ